MGGHRWPARTRQDGLPHHPLHEGGAERLADRIAIIAAGEIVAEGTPRTLGGRHLSGAQISFELPDGATVDDLPATLAERAQEQVGGRIVLHSASIAGDLHELSGWALDRDLELDELEVRRPTLEDVYLELTTHNDKENSK